MLFFLVSLDYSHNNHINGVGLLQKDVANFDCYVFIVNGKVT